MKYGGLIAMAERLGFSAELEAANDLQEQLTFASPAGLALFTTAIRTDGAYIFPGLAAPPRLFRLPDLRRIEEFWSQVLSESQRLGIVRLSHSFFNALIKAYDLEEMNWKRWDQSCQRIEEARWEQLEWHGLSDEEDLALWNEVRGHFVMDHRQAPFMRFKPPAIAIDISWALQIRRSDSTWDRQTFVAVELEAELQMLGLWRACLDPGEEMLAWWWHHMSFRFIPHACPQPSLENLWPYGIIPTSEYQLFMPRDFRFGIFGNPFDKTLTFFGETLVEAVNRESKLTWWRGQDRTMKRITPV